MNGLKVFWHQYREMLPYLVFGVLTFLVSIGTYALFNMGMGINELIANVISWIFAVTFAYVTNKIWVFQSRGLDVKGTTLEVFKFFGGRIFTLAIEELILFIFISRMQFGSMQVKVVAQVVVIILNYVVSKLFVFRRKKKESD